MDTSALHATIRFGLGPRAGETPPRDARAWLAGQLDGDDPQLSRPGFGAADGLRAMVEDRKQPLPQGQPTRGRQIWLSELAAALGGMVDAELPFRERLVWFWANHFTISVRHGEMFAIAVSFVREAIRPHVTGRFVDMLQAVMHHPAMLHYLDNAEFFGPDSPAGIAHKRGLNENLARECLELHTITPAAGYTQQDVTGFARLLTGWGVEPNGATPGFFFYPKRHQPGAQTILGRVWPEGQAGGEAVLDWLGTHPSSYRHIATQLVRHFVADDPPAADVARVAAALTRTGGSLKAAALEVVGLESAWRPQTKLRAPIEYTVAAIRALGLPADNRPDLMALANVLGQPFLAAPLPNGWADTEAAWGDGELLLRRADWAMGVSGRAPTLDPMAVADAALGPMLSATTRQAVRLAPSRRMGLALLLASPEFLRR